jgi:hypothetical protein
VFFMNNRVGPSPTVVEDPDHLGYRLVIDPLLDLMSVDEWQALERAAREAAVPGGRIGCDRYPM